ncbi:hypothetical protein I7I53_01271 [Histoplasma capsulatum var. duboisii H88]|uniref:Uncharacterized protein n=1 Tax=Ajellomyces capsulatus (strain H88) TaxID=544711 RepID=A0A8A1LIU8_AJEC8|nr:hypothetical protein I7I53_01271 [Histoplasma capsulatum var. duboisii H88]
MRCFVSDLTADLGIDVSEPKYCHNTQNLIMAHGLILTTVSLMLVYQGSHQSILSLRSNPVFMDLLSCTSTS